MNSENNRQNRGKNTIDVCEPDMEQRNRYLLGLPDDRFGVVSQGDGVNSFMNLGMKRPERC